MIGVTAQQKRVLDFVTCYLQSQWGSPTLREIAVGVGLYGPRQAKLLIDSLVERGRLVIVRHGEGRRTSIYALPVAVAGASRQPGIATAYRGPYPIRSGITCADFDRAGNLLRRAAAPSTRSGQSECVL